MVLVAGVLALGLGPGPRSARADDGQLRWMTIETEHFVINYYEPNEDLARRVAQVAERSHAVLSVALGHVPDEKCQVVIVDDTDGANGFASVLPRNAITLFATAPDNLSTLGDHDDWLYGLVAHEYTHILHLDTIEGLPRYYNAIFGKQWAPNQIQPRWFIEGLAAYEESRRSSSGRVRGAIFDMYLRAAVLAGKPIDLDALSSGPIQFPQGNAAYLYGSHFLDFIADRYGDDALKTISHEYGRYPIPFGLNRAVQRAVGKDYVTLYAEWLEFLGQKYALQRAAVERRGLREGRQITFSGQSASTPRYTPDGRELAWGVSDGKVHGHYRIGPVGQDEGASRKLVEIEAAGGFTFAPDGRSIYFERGVTFRTNYAFGDLFRHDLASGTTTRLTRGLRASDPEISPDGTKLATTVNGRSKLRLAIIDLTAPVIEAEIVWEGEARFDQAFTPRWSPDGWRLVFSVWSKGGERDLWLYDVASREARRLMHDRAMDVDPVWSPDGRWIYFSSDRTGIFNIYAMRVADGELRQVTNVLGGAFSAAPSPDGTRLAYVGFSWRGYDIFELLVDEARWLVPEPYVNDRPEATVIGDDETRVDGPRDYSPLGTVGPRTWTLNVTLDTAGSSASISTQGIDIIGRHAWSFGTTWRFAENFTDPRATFAGSYAYNRFWPSLRLAGARTINSAGGRVIDGQNRAYTEELWSGSASVNLPVLRTPELSGDLGLGYAIDWLRNLDGMPAPRPDQGVPRAPEVGVIAGVTVRASFNNTRRTLRSVGPTEGRAISAQLRYNDPDVGGDFRSLELTYRWAEFFQMPWAYGQTAALQLRGGLEETERRRDGAFGLGSLSEQNVAQAVIESTRVGTQVLRGYEPGKYRGRQFHLMNAEYRVGLGFIERGLATLPVYVNRAHAALLFDAGFASDDDFSWAQVRPTLGAALRLDAVFGYYEAGTFELGMARGLADDGLWEWWFLLTGVP